MTRIYTKINRVQKTLSDFQNLTGLLYFRCSGNVPSGTQYTETNIPSLTEREATQMPVFSTHIKSLTGFAFATI